MIYILIGIRRSGNHAILNWLYPMLGNYCHLNDLKIQHFTKENYDNNITDCICDKNYVDCKWIPFNKNSNLLISFEKEQQESMKSDKNK